MKLYLFFKRFLDIFISLAALAVLSPLFLLLSLVCAADTRTSPFFLQERIGKNSRIFKIIKFRTMKKTAPVEIPLRAIENPHEYVSRIGAWLRRSGLDELPQLFNIIAGHMSIVGPRPLMISEGRLHREREELGVYLVRPGLTGLAQIRCDSIDSVEDKAALDFEYVTKMSFFYDVKMIFLTFARFFSGKHIDEHFESPVS